MTAFVAWLRRLLCGLHGHDALPQFERDRMYLRCVSCGHETAGWDLKDPTPAPIVSAKVRRFQKRIAA